MNRESFNSSGITIAGMPNAPQLPPGITRRPWGTYQAQVWSVRDNRRLSKTFDKLGPAKAWKRDTERALAMGSLVAAEAPTLRAAGTAWLEAADAGTVRNRSGDRYRPSTLRGYRRALEERLFKELGSQRLSEIRRGQVNTFIGRLQADGLSASTIRNVVMPLRAIFRWAIDQELVAINPTRDLSMPADRARRDRFATREEIDLLLATLKANDRPLWATAFYAGLRRGELMALRWSDVDLASGSIHVTRSHDPDANVTGEPKSVAGRRKVPIPGALRDHLLEHRMRAKPLQPLVFARSTLGGRRRRPDGPFNSSAVYARAKKRWEDAGLTPISFHGCRHTYASLMIAAGESPKALQTYMGHSSITVTFDRYGHLFPDAMVESATRLQAFLDQPLDEGTAAQSAADAEGSGSTEPRTA